LADGSVDCDQILFYAARRVGRSDRDEIRLLARRRRRIRRDESGARRESLEGKTLRGFGADDFGRERFAAARPRRAHAAHDQHAVAREPEAFIRPDGRAWWL